jgi:hypothetical protein
MPPDTRLGDPGTRIGEIARDEEFDLIIIPTHAGRFRQMLLGSTAAKVLDDAPCPVLTTKDAETIAPRPLEHREWLFNSTLGVSLRTIQSDTTVSWHAPFLKRILERAGHKTDLKWSA